MDPVSPFGNKGGWKPSDKSYDRKREHQSEGSCEILKEIHFADTPRCPTESGVQQPGTGCGSSLRRSSSMLDYTRDGGVGAQMGLQGDPDDRLEVESGSQSEHPDDVFVLITNRIDDHLDRR